MIQVIALVLGALFGAGLYIAGMTNPAKIVNFLDIAGTWDPSLIFVMGGGIPVAAIGFIMLRRRARPVIFADSQVPQGARLIIHWFWAVRSSGSVGEFRVFVRVLHLRRSCWSLA